MNIIDGKNHFPDGGEKERLYRRIQQIRSEIREENRRIMLLVEEKEYIDDQLRRAREKLRGLELNRDRLVEQYEK